MALPRRVFFAVCAFLFASACADGRARATNEVHSAMPRDASAAQMYASVNATPDTFGFGRSVGPEEISRWDIDVSADGTGLPEGSGTVVHGSEVYGAKCASCHGVAGEGGAAGALVGRQPGDAFPFAEDQEAPRVIGSYWPFAPTIFDYVRRSMPYDRPGSLTDQEVYSLTAFLLHKNELLPEDAVLTADLLRSIHMPARERFIRDDRLDHEVVH